jgi:hypothetical protein
MDGKPFKDSAVVAREGIKPGAWKNFLLLNTARQGASGRPAALSLSGFPNLQN